MASAVTKALQSETWDGHVLNVAELQRALHELRPRNPDGSSIALAAVLNLVAIANGHTATEIDALISTLHHQPSRAIIIERIATGDGIDAHLAARAQLSRPTGVATRIELLQLQLHGPAVAGAASAIEALIRPDLPVFVLWPGAIAPTDPLFGAIASRADRLITEVPRADGADAIHRLSDLVATTRPAVTDLAWAALTPWRQLINQIITQEHLDGIRDGAKITIAHSTLQPTVGTLLFAGWLCDSAGTAVGVDFRSDLLPGDPRVTGIEISIPHHHTITIQRVTGRAAAAITVVEGDGATTESVLPLREPTRAELLTGELQLQRRDLPFERALSHALRICRA